MIPLQCPQGKKHLQQFATLIEATQKHCCWLYYLSQVFSILQTIHTICGWSAVDRMRTAYANGGEIWLRMADK